jgi:hypothetical protein
MAQHLSHSELHPQQFQTICQQSLNSWLIETWESWSRQNSNEFSYQCPIMFLIVCACFICASASKEITATVEYIAYTEVVQKLMPHNLISQRVTELEKCYLKQYAFQFLSFYVRICKGFWHMTPLLQLFKVGLPVKHRTCCKRVPVAMKKYGGKHAQTAQQCL